MPYPYAIEWKSKLEHSSLRMFDTAKLPFTSGRLTKENLSGFNQICCNPPQKMSANIIANMVLPFLKQNVPEIQNIYVTGRTASQVDTSMVQFKVTFKES